MSLYGFVVHMHAHIASMIEELDSPGRRYALAPLANMNHKRDVMDSTLLRKIAHHQLGLLGKETWKTKCGHFEALLRERKPSKRQFGDTKQWSGFIDTDGVAMVLHCNHRVKEDRQQELKAGHSSESNEAVC